MPAPTVHEKREINRGNLAVSIPFDLLSDIFIRLMESEMTPTSNYIPPTALLAVRKMRHTFCQVCHVWREAAIATKRIWAVVGFPHAAQELKTKRFLLVPSSFSGRISI
ncbi:hypothetical protein DL93DRAFT_1764314 [Clavulina sp. PMI_390]|nr:hypothetical protein DL93DRAFT_1764314 [Clavulina sp. PMI_390]